MNLQAFFDHIVARSKSWLRATTHRGRLEAEMEAELAHHLDLLTGDLTRAGHSPQEAARRARIALGTQVTHKENMRASLGLRWFDELRADVFYGLRILRKSPGFTAVAAISLALAIGANTAIFSIAKSLLYDHLSVNQASQLRIVGWHSDGHSAVHGYWTSFNAPSVGMSSECFSYPILQQLQKNSHGLIDLFGYKDFYGTGNVRGEDQRMTMELVTGNYFGALGVRPQLGRAIQPSDAATPGNGAVAVISDGLWQRSFGRSPAVLGQTITLNNVPVTIVGVNPGGFTGARTVQLSPDVFVPVTMQPLVNPMQGKDPSLLTDADNWWIEAMGRQHAGVADAQVRAALDTELAAAVRAQLTIKAGETIPRLVLADGSRGLHPLDAVRQPVEVLLVLVGLVLLLACANIANLLLARGAQRMREMSVRLALGAGRSRIMRQMFTESLLLAVLGGALGLLLGYAGRNAIPSLLTSSSEQGAPQFPFDWGVFAFTTAITLVTGLFFGLAPAWSAARNEVGSSLKENAQTITRRRRGLGGKSLVTFQIVLSTLLVIGAGLFLRTVLSLSAIDTGFKTDHLLLADVELTSTRYPDDKGIAIHQQIEQAMAAVPGVASVSPMSMPLIADSETVSTFVTEAESADPDKAKGERTENVGNTFFSTLGIPIIAGRGFGPQDTAGSSKVAVINQSLARTRFPHANPIGSRFRAGDAKSPWIQVIGICADTRYSNLREDPPPQVFLPYVQQMGAWDMTYAIRSSAGQAALIPALRHAVRQIDSTVPLTQIRTQQEQIDETMRMERTLAALTAGFGLLALALAAVGIYGIMAYSVASRRNEIGIRMALGAQPGQVRGMILCESSWLAGVGILVGVGVAFGLTRLIKTMLYGIQPYDPATLTGGVSILLVVALAASWIPATRAARVQPMDALRHE